jgi:hypothetical protein
MSGFSQVNHLSPRAAKERYFQITGGLESHPRVRIPLALRFEALSGDERKKRACRGDAPLAALAGGQ